ncbi:MAG TPA: LptF/LptG family permease [Gemmatimonadaceae bacterium]|nr:LptF/LptG family permease [Gemmatimonadaceae bacterium]
MKIVTKYILREHAGPLVFALSALTSLMLLNYVAKQLGNLVGKQLGWPVIAEFLVLSVPLTVALTLPMAVLVSTLHAFSRMAAENEIIAFKASGLSMRRLMVPVILASAVLTLTMVWFNDQVLPRANHELSNLTSDIARKKPTFALKEQVINEVTPNKLFLRMVHLERGTSIMRDVTIFDLVDPQKRRTIRADSGLLQLSPDGRDLDLTLYTGAMIEISPQDPTRLQRNFFRTDYVRVAGVGNQLERSAANNMKGDREMTVCELQERVVRETQLRDSAYRELMLLDPAAARGMKLPSVRGGLGDLYCRRLRNFSFIRAAHAQTPAPIPPRVVPPVPQVPQVRPQVPPQVPPQAPARAPSSGTLRPDPVTSLDSSTRSVLAETEKVGLREAQRVINGNQVEIEKKFAIAVACFIFVLLGAPIALRFPRGGIGMTIGVSLGVFGVYYVGLIVGELFARRGQLSPFWAMWAANIGLLIIGLWLTAQLGREGATSRGSETSERLQRLRERVAGLVRRGRGTS